MRFKRDENHIKEKKKIVMTVKLNFYIRKQHNTMIVVLHSLKSLSALTITVKRVLYRAMSSAKFKSSSVVVAEGSDGL